VCAAVALEDEDVQAALRCAPRNRQSDQATTDDDYVVTFHRIHAGTLGPMEHRQRLAAARLYLIADLPTLARVLDGALGGGVDVVQVRSPDPAPEELAAVRDRCRAAGALFIVNDDPALAAAVDADGVHVGQDDIAVSQARELVGAKRLVGLSTHSQAQIDAAAGVDYIGVGPVWADADQADLRARRARARALCGSPRTRAVLRDRRDRPVECWRGVRGRCARGSPSSGRSERASDPRAAARALRGAARVVHA
jgi:hypothetical protein